MTLAELSYSFFKTHLLMGTGYAVGEKIEYIRNISCPWLFGLLIGLLFSLHIYIKGITVLIDEYKRLKTKNINENLA